MSEHVTLQALRATRIKSNGIRFWLQINGPSPDEPKTKMQVSRRKEADAVFKIIFKKH